ncbi:MAG: ester cyclase, partial [Pseudomonadota bacterium]
MAADQRRVDRHTAHKALIAPIRAALYDYDAAALHRALSAALAPDAVVRLANPLGEMVGVSAFIDTAFAPLAAAMPDFERRDTIVVAGDTPEGEDWVGTCGAYVGTFVRPWLDIAPTGHVASVRFHEFYRVVEGAVCEIQALWDVPAVMMQAGAWPMA